MFLTIGTTMPQNKPDSLTPQIVIDIISFLLKSNEMPPGSSELPPDLEALKIGLHGIPPVEVTRSAGL